MIIGGSEKFNERELEAFYSKKKERELILLQFHVVFIYHFHFVFSRSLRYNFIYMSSSPTRMTRSSSLKDGCSQISSSALNKVQIYFQLRLYLGEMLVMLHKDTSFFSSWRVSESIRPTVRTEISCGFTNSAI